MNTLQEWRDNYKIEERHVFTVQHPSLTQTHYFSTKGEAEHFADICTRQVAHLFEDSEEEFLERVRGDRSDG